MYAVKTKGLISCVVAAFVFAYAKSRFSNDVAHIISEHYMESSVQKREYFGFNFCQFSIN